MSEKPFAEHTDRHVLLVRPLNRPGVIDAQEWEVFVETHPKYADNTLDDPIRLLCSHRIDTDFIDFYPEEAEAVAHALLRAVEIRHEAVRQATIEAACLKDRP